MNQNQLHLQIAVVMSLLLHSLLFGVYQLRHTIVPWLSQRSSVRQAAATKPARQQAPTITFVEAPAVPKPKEETKPQIFIETDERQRSTEKPAATPYYSDKTTVAMNPENLSKVEGDTPYLDGKNTKLLSTESVPAPTPGAVALSQRRLQQARQVAQPATPPAQPKPKELPAEGEKATKPAEEQKMAMATGAAAQRGTAAIEEQAAESSPLRPGAAFPGREIAAAKSELKASGVSRKGIAAFGVAESPFGDYDRRLIKEVQQRWYVIIDKLGVYEKAGTVTIYFQLSDDGSISNLRRKENTAGEILALWCEKAITDSAPFDPLTADLRRLVGKEPREVNFTFYY